MTGQIPAEIGSKQWNPRTNPDARRREMEVAPLPQAPIQSAIAGIFSSLGNLHQTIREVEKRLESILGPEEPASLKTPDEKPARLLTDSLAGINELICHANNSLHKINERLLL